MPASLGWLPLLVFWVWAPSARSATPSLQLDSVSPVVLDADIVFSAQLKDFDPDRSPQFVFKWSDNVSPAHWRENKTYSRQQNLTLQYKSTVYEPGAFKMTCTVYVVEPFDFHIELASASADFRITKQLNGRLLFNGHLADPNSHHRPLVTTTNDTQLQVDLYDPTQFLAEARLHYFWFVNDTNYGQTSNATLPFRFRQPGVSSVEATVIAYMNGDAATPPLNVSASASPSASPSPDTKFGVFRLDLESRRPLSANLSLRGNTWLKHGELLQLNVSCDGSGPWQYCWSIRQSPYNVTGNETCLDPAPLFGQCSFPIIWYFRKSGTSDILVLVSNGVSTVRQLVHVNIYEKQRSMPWTLFAIPVAALVATLFIALLFTVSVIKLKRNISIETADFDFGAVEDEELEFKTFWERLRDSMLSTFSSAGGGSGSGDSMSQVSSVSSRSVQPPVGIHYGSIT